MRWGSFPQLPNQGLIALNTFIECRILLYLGSVSERREYRVISKHSVVIAGAESCTSVPLSASD
jgi:hypothetical protein